MILMMFPTPLPELLTGVRAGYQALGETGVEVRRMTPATRPRRFVLLTGGFGPRVDNVHRLYRLRAQVWATFPDGTTDWDTVTRLASQLHVVIERLAKTSPTIAKVTDSSGPDPVQDPVGAEYQFATAELKIRGIAA